MCKISIIVPVYNCEEYIEKSLSCLLMQNIQNLQIILVNDGSEDNSETICKRLAEKSDRVTYVYQENGGPGKARNTGLNLVKGEYTAFCDADDTIDPALYEKLIHYLEKNDADMAMCDFYNERDKKNMGLPWKDNAVLNREDILHDLIPRMTGNVMDDDTVVPIWGSACRCLFKSKILKNHKIVFPTDITFAEDLIFVFRYLLFTQRVAVCNQVLYYYTMNPHSIMNSHKYYQAEMFSKRKQLMKYIKEILQQFDIFVDTKERFYCTARQYINECAGNACSNGSIRGKKAAYNEVKQIVNDPVTIEVFKVYHSKVFKRRLCYWAIRHKMSFLLYFYYTNRLKYRQYAME
ncbi:MAG: hypothetical protein K0S55_1402 [Clostridia bacterium]|nr:hypothetical protein [Clostridia bacterium]